MSGYATLRPKSVVIHDSLISGQGLFAAEEIRGGECIGISHIAHEAFEDGFIRTTIGAMINHGGFPNCDYKADKEDPSIIWLYARYAIHSGEELTVRYGRIVPDFTLE